MLLGYPWRPLARVESHKEAILEMARSLHEALWITFPVYVQTWERTSPDCLIGNEYGKEVGVTLVEWPMGLHKVMLKAHWEKAAGGCSCQSDHWGSDPGVTQWPAAALATYGKEGGKAGHHVGLLGITAS